MNKWYSEAFTIPRARWHTTLHKFWGTDFCFPFFCTSSWLHNIRMFLGCSRSSFSWSGRLVLEPYQQYTKSSCHHVQSMDLYPQRWIPQWARNTEGNRPLGGARLDRTGSRVCALWKANKQAAMSVWTQLLLLYACVSFILHTSVIKLTHRANRTWSRQIGPRPQKTQAACMYHRLLRTHRFS